MPAELKRQKGMTMKLDRTLWHVRFYFWCTIITDEFLGTNTSERQSNICQYIRTLFIWFPLAIVLNVAIWIYAMYVLVYFPLAHFGIGGAVSGYISVAALIGAIWGWIQYRAKAREKKRRAQYENNDEYTNERDENNRTGLIRVLATYAVSVKEKMCIPIEFTSRTKGVQ